MTFRKTAPIVVGVAILLLALFTVLSTRGSEPSAFSDLFTEGSESYATGGSVGRMDGNRSSICDNHRNFRDAAQVVSNLNGKAMTVRDTNGTAAGCGVKYANFTPKAHVAMEYKDAQGSYHGTGNVSHH